MAGHLSRKTATSQYTSPKFSWQFDCEEGVGGEIDGDTRNGGDVGGNGRDGGVGKLQPLVSKSKLASSPMNP